MAQSLNMQNQMVKKYKLGAHDRYFLMMNGSAGRTGVVIRKREENSLNKLVEKGLLQKVQTKFGTFDYLLTDLGKTVSAHITSTR